MKSNTIRVKIQEIGKPSVIEGFLFRDLGRCKMQTIEQEKLWYVLHTYSGYENKVKANLESRIQSMGMEDYIFRVVVPEEEVTEVKNGKEKVVMDKTFPGYVLLEMIMSDQAWYVVRNTPGVTGFIGSHGAGSKPTPLLPEEVETVLRRMGISLRQHHDMFKVGESVVILDGSFNGMNGIVEAVDVEKEKLKVTVEMFGRKTTAEVDFNHVDKM